jgi:hypothetical protein
MPQHLWIMLLLACCAAPVAALEVPGTCQVNFAATSTLHDFTGTAACTPFVLITTDTAAGEVEFEDVTLAVPVSGMRTGIDRRDHTMRAMFAVERFPRIVGRLPPAQLADGRRQLHRALAAQSAFPLLLRIRDREQSVAARVTRLSDTRSGFELELQFPVSLAGYGLQPPTVLGFIRVGDEVSVKVNVQLAPLPTPWPP